MKTDKLSKLCLVLTVLSILWMIFIFSNSLKNSEQSRESSDSVVEIIKPLVDPEDKVYDEYFSSVVRKVAHGLEFMVLGILTSCLYLCVYLKKRKMYIYMPFLISLLTASLDEFIQSFTGRDSRIMDVVIDMGGAVTGILLVSLVAAAVHLWRKKRTCNK